MREDIMVTCLDEIDVRAAADGEAGQAVRAHLETCGTCRARVDAAAATAADLGRMARAIPVPEGLEARVLAATQGKDAARVVNRGGATTLRGAPPRRWIRPAWMSGCALAASILAFVFFMPMANAPATLSAAEILGRSLEKWAPGSGTELLEFDLTVDLPAITGVDDGTYRVDQLIDHDTPGRYRVTRYAPGGALISALSENAASGRRTVLVPTDEGTFVFGFAIQPQHGVGLRDIERHHVEAMVRLLQTLSGDTVAEVGEGSGKRYVVELPPLANAGGQQFWQLATARVVIDATSFEVLEVAASGSYMGEPFSLSFRLRRRLLRPTAAVPAAEFDVPADPAAIVIEAPGTDNVAHDLFSSALRELARRR